MPQYDNTNKGILFRETKKKSEKSPDFTGKLDVNGHEMRLAGWFKEGRSGAKFISLALSEPQERKEEPASQDNSFQDDDDWV